jgi:hypothetical protein
MITETLSSETSVLTKSTLRHIPEVGVLQVAQKLCVPADHFYAALDFLYREGLRAQYHENCSHRKLLCPLVCKYNCTATSRVWSVPMNMYWLVLQ